MEGLTILHKIPVRLNKLNIAPGLIGSISTIMVLAIVWIWPGFTDKSTAFWLPIAVVSSILAILLNVLLWRELCKHVNQYTYEYIIRADQNAKLNEFLYIYNIISSNGNIYTVRKNRPEVYER